MPTVGDGSGSGSPSLASVLYPFASPTHAAPGRAKKKSSANGSGSDWITQFYEVGTNKQGPNNPFVPGGKYSYTVPSKKRATQHKLLAPPPNPDLVKIKSAHGAFKRNDPVIGSKYRPMVQPGQQARVGRDFARCRLVPQNRTTAAGDPNPYEFVFPYNPDNVTLSTSVNPGVKLQTEVDTTTRNILAVGGTLTVTAMLDRQQEIWTNQKSKWAGPGPGGHDRNFRDFGTLYDIEFIYRVFNGEPPELVSHPSKSKNQQILGLVDNQSNPGFLFPTTCEIYMNPAMRFLGFPIEFDVQHVKYTPTMVPMLSQISLTFTLVVNAAGPRPDATTGQVSNASLPQWAQLLTGAVSS